MKTASLNRNLHILFLFIIAHSALTDTDVFRDLYTWWFGGTGAFFLLIQSAVGIWVVQFIKSVLSGWRSLQEIDVLCGGTPCCLFQS